MTKNVRDIQGPALAIVLDRLKPYGASRGTKTFLILILTIHIMVYLHQKLSTLFLS